MKKKILVIVLFVLAVLCLSGVVTYKYLEPFIWSRNFDSLVMEEDNAEAVGPCRGVYRIYGYEVSDGNIVDIGQVKDNAGYYDTECLALVDIRIVNYRNGDISESGLKQIGDYLDAMADSGKDIILRFVYDWNGEDITKEEPEDISGIIRHIEQLAPVINERKKDIIILQGTFAGLYGEMHGSEYTSSENSKILINKLSEVIDPDIFLAVRTPRFYRYITGNADTNALKLTRERSVLANRLSLYNDGMFGSQSDVGTYGDKPFSEIDGLTQGADRTSEICFQDVLCRFVPNGGEVIIDNEYNDPPGVIEDMRNMHITYINDTYDTKVLEKWKNTTFTDEKGNTSSTYDYIRSHLGYRYVIDDVKWESGSFPDWNEKISVTVSNVGFAPFYRDSSISIILEGEDGSVKELHTDISPCDIEPRDNITINSEIDKRDLLKGNYRLSISFKDNVGEQDIPFANKGYERGSYYTLGTLAVE